MRKFKQVSKIVDVIFYGIAYVVIHRDDAVFVVFALPYKNGFTVKINVFCRQVTGFHSAHGATVTKGKNEFQLFMPLFPKSKIIILIRQGYGLLQLFYFLYAEWDNVFYVFLIVIVEFYSEIQRRWGRVHSHIGKELTQFIYG